jgi:ABC-type transport system involved in cytochrome c biogenesis permease subunit
LLAQASTQPASEQGAAQAQAEDAEKQRQREQAEREIYRRNRLAAQVKMAMMWLSLLPAVLFNLLLTWKARFLEPWSRLFISVFFGALLMATFATFAVQVIQSRSLATAGGADGLPVFTNSALFLGTVAALWLLGKMTTEFARKH